MTAQPEDHPDELPSKLPISPELLLSSMSDTVLVLDREARWVWAAPTRIREIEAARRRVEWLIGKTIPEVIEDPETASRLVNTLDAALGTGETQRIDYEVDIGEQSRWFSAAVSRLDDDHVLWVARDITEIVNANRLLEESVDARTREVNALLEVSRALSSATTLPELAEALLAQLKRVIDYTGAAVVRMEGTNITIIDSIGPGGREHDIVGVTLDMGVAPHWWAQLREGHAVVIEDARADGGQAFRELLAGYQQLPAFSYIRSWMAVPLLHEERLVGMLSLSKDVPGYFTDNHIDLATAVARQAAVAFENAALFEETRRKTRELAAQLDVSRALASTLDLGELLGVILDQLHTLVDYAGAAVALREGDNFRQVAVRRPRGPTPTQADLGDIVTYEQLNAAGFPLTTDAYIIVDDTTDDSRGARDFRDLNADERERATVEYVRSFMGFPLVFGDEVVGVLTVGHDEPGFFGEKHVDLLRPFADQAAIAIQNASLYEETRRRTRELTALLDVSGALASTLELTPLLELILDRLEEFVPYAGAAISLREGDQMRQVVVRRPRGGPVTPDDTQRVFPAQIYDQFANDEPAVIPDVRADDPLAAVYREPYGGRLEGSPVEYVKSFVSFPLRSRDETVGALTMAHDEVGFFTPELVEILRPLADTAAIAIANAELFQAIERRTRELAALLEVSRTVASTLDAREVLSSILDQLGAITEHTGASILLVRDDSFEFVEARSNTGVRAPAGVRIPFNVAPDLSAVMRQGETVIIDDVNANEPLAADYRAAIDSIGIRNQLPFSVIRSWMAVPLAVKDRVLGVLTISWTEPSYFTQDHARLARAFADQAVVAMENARLFAQTGQVAAMEERQRLARELHDSVSQALYGIALGARTAREQLDRDPSKAADPVEYVLSLAEAGLAEMRALIFELRPESLESEGLVVALEKQAAALQARHRIEVTCDLCDEPDVVLPVKEAAYRIVQEAFTNIMKHAGAKAVRVNLRAENGYVRLEIIDDGRGFDAGATYAGHLGLHSMSERAAKLGGELAIESSRGSGTRIVATLPSS